MREGGALSATAATEIGGATAPFCLSCKLFLNGTPAAARGDATLLGRPCLGLFRAVFCAGFASSTSSRSVFTVAATALSLVAPCPTDTGNSAARTQHVWEQRVASARRATRGAQRRFLLLLADRGGQDEEEEVEEKDVEEGKPL
jgi:hypothetical protein